MKRRVLALLAMTALLAAQDEPAAGKKAAKAKVKVLNAIVMRVKGMAQARPKPGAKWKKLAKNDVLEPGALVRTGRKGRVALRIGRNATVIVERMSRVALPEIVEDGQVLRTRLAMKFGKASVKVNRIGLVNDFEVATPTATLAVRGTSVTLSWDAIDFFQAAGADDNDFRSVEVAYLHEILIFLSGADASSDAYRLPAVQAFFGTYLLPLLGALDPSELPDQIQSPELIFDLLRETGLEAAHALRGSKLPR